MTKAAATPLLQSPLIRLVLIIGCAALAIFTSFQFAFPHLFERRETMVDFEAFYIVGQLVWDNALSEAYHAQTMFAAQDRMLGKLGFMPWTYPPHYNFVTAGLALMPIWLGYAIFVLTSLLAYVWTIKRLAGQHQTFVLLTLFPAILICIRTGQNGLLVGALMASAMLLLLERRAIAGVPLGLLTIKPHFLPAIGLYLLLQAQWRVIGVACAVTLSFALASTAAFGFGVWYDVIDAVGEASGFLQAGLYPLYRMTSLYAALFMQGIEPPLALLLQLALGLGWLGILIWATRARWPIRQILATAVIASLFISPYAYDYDLPILGVALSLIAADITARASAPHLAFFVCLAWLLSGVSAVQSFESAQLAMGSREVILARPASFGAFGLLPLSLMALWLARRPLPGLKE